MSLAAEKNFREAREATSINTNNTDSFVRQIGEQSRQGQLATFETVTYVKSDKKLYPFSSILTEHRDRIAKAEQGVSAASGAAPSALAPAAAAKKPAKPAKAATDPVPATTDGKIAVKPGDSLSAISRDSDLLKDARKHVEAAIGTNDPLTVQLVLSMTLAKVNDIKKPDNLYPIKPLLVPTEEQIKEVAGKMKLTTALVDDGKISGKEYKELMKGKTVEEILAPAATPLAKPAAAAPAK